MILRNEAVQPILSALPLDLAALNRKDLHDYLTNTWDLYETLFSSIRDDEALFQQPDPLRNPMIFYLGHTAAFYINKALMSGLLDKGIQPRLERIFAKGVDPACSNELDYSEPWPTANETRAYRKSVIDVVHGIIDSVELRCPIGENDPLWALLMGLEHDRIHFETSSVLLRQYPVDVLARPSTWNYAPTLGRTPAERMMTSAGGEVCLGKARAVPTYGWDTEYGELRVMVRPFEASRDLVTNEAFLDFVKAGGYDNPALWCDEGNVWRKESGAVCPRFWVPSSDGYRYRAMFDELALPLDWPVEVNWLEATAYCRWRGNGLRLLSESEHAFLIQNAPSMSDPMFSRAFNLHLKYGSPCPVGMMADTSSSTGFNDLFGNVWRWLSDSIYAFPGFEPHPLYPDYSTPYFDPLHSMVVAGSWATTGAATSKYCRSWYRRHFMQHAGFRVARSC